MLNLGLGALVKKEEEVREEVLSYEYLDTVMMYNEACEELTIVCDQFDQICVAYENLLAISEVIREHGVTPALEALVGGNFVGGFSLEASEEAKEGAWEKIKSFIKTIWQAIKNFFLKFFSTTDGMRKRLIAFKEKANKEGATVNVDTFTGIKAETLGNYSINFASGADLKLSDADIKKYGDQIGEVVIGTDKAKAIAYADNLQKILSDFSKRKEEYLKFADGQIAAAEKLEDEAKRTEEVAKAKAAKELIGKTFKAVYSSAAGFLSHAKVDGGKDEAKKDDAKPAENAEAGKEGEGK